MGKTWGLLRSLVLISSNILEKKKKNPKEKHFSRNRCIEIRTSSDMMFRLLSKDHVSGEGESKSIFELLSSRVEILLAGLITSAKQCYLVQLPNIELFAIQMARVDGRKTHSWSHLSKRCITPFAVKVFPAMILTPFTKILPPSFTLTVKFFPERALSTVPSVRSVVYAILPTTM